MDWRQISTLNGEEKKRVSERGVLIMIKLNVNNGYCDEWWKCFVVISAFVMIKEKSRSTPQMHISTWQFNLILQVIECIRIRLIWLWWCDRIWHWVTLSIYQFINGRWIKDNNKTNSKVGWRGWVTIKESNRDTVISSPYEQANKRHMSWGRTWWRR